MRSGDIRNGEYLEIAKETSVEDFFEKRMTNRIKKVLGANWEILFETSDFVYFGYPLISFFREGTFLEEFFKVNKTNLEFQFAPYREFDGIFMNQFCREKMNLYTKAKPEKRFLSMDCKSSLIEDIILIRAKLNFENERNDRFIENYLLRLDKKNQNLQGITREREQ